MIVRKYSGNSIDNFNFIGIDSNIYELGSSFTDQAHRNKDENKRLEEIIRKNPEYSIYIVQANNNVISNIKELPLVSMNVAQTISNINNISNFALAINKYGRLKEKKLEYSNLNQNGLFRAYQHNSQLIYSIADKINRNLTDIASHNNVVIGTYSLTSRFAMGLGVASAYNNGFTFHPVYGIPYIPGQRIKNIIRNYLIIEYFNKREEEAFKDPMFNYLFGCRENLSPDIKARKGNVEFFDSFPINHFQIEPDIINPHYKDYYEGNSEPHDAISPVPIIFLTLKNAEFNISFSISKAKDIKCSDLLYNKYDEDLKKEIIGLKYIVYGEKKAILCGDFKVSELVQVILETALVELGVGAKTKIGYGRFRKINNVI